MLDLGYILAQRRSDDDGGWVKFIFGALIVGFWIISALASALSKKQEKERRERVQQELEHSELATAAPKSVQRHRPAELAPQVAMRIPPPAKPRQPARPLQRAQQIKPRRVPVKPTTVASPRLAHASAAQTITVAPTPPAPAMVRPQPTIATAVSIRRWLTPATLRQQFVLTEILQPPKALREPGI